MRMVHDDQQVRHVVLVGLMAAGESTIGVHVADRLHRPYIDNDAELARATNHTAREVTELSGIDTLHRMEADMLVALLARDEPAVISGAASSITDAHVRDALAAHFVVWLDISLDTLAARVEQKQHRPQFAGTPREYLELQVLAQRPRELRARSEEHTSELQSLRHLVCRLLLEK